MSSSVYPRPERCRSKDATCTHPQAHAPRPAGPPSLVPWTDTHRSSRPRARTSSAGHPSPLITASSPTGLTPVRRLSGLSSASQPTPIDDRWPPQPAHHSVLTHRTLTGPSTRHYRPGLSSASQPTPIDDRWPPQPAHHSVLTHRTHTGPPTLRALVSITANTHRRSLATPARSSQRPYPPSIHHRRPNPTIDTQKSHSVPILPPSIHALRPSASAPSSGRPGWEGGSTQRCSTRKKAESIACAPQFMADAEPPRGDTLSSHLATPDSTTWSNHLEAPTCRSGRIPRLRKPAIHFAISLIDAHIESTTAAPRSTDYSCYRFALTAIIGSSLVAATNPQNTYEVACAFIAGPRLPRNRASPVVLVL
jgi:hypothetical protein